METRVAVMSIIVENGDAVERINALLHEHGEFIIGRMGELMGPDAMILVF